MRVAVYFQDLAPDVGGGYTVESDIRQALAAARGNSPHHVMAAGYAPDAPLGWDPGDYVSLYWDEGNGIVGKGRRRVAAAIRRRAGPKESWPDEVLKSNSIDLIWCVAAGAPTYSLPYVTTVWDLQHRRQPIFPEVAAGDEWQRRERYLSREIGQATAIIVGTDVGRDEVERFYGVPRERIHKLPHPTPSFALEAQAGDDSALSRYELAPGYVLYPAQFWAHKNHVGLLHALKRLRDDQGITLTAVFVGSDKGNEAHVRAVAVGLGLRDHVRFLGFVPRADLVALYRNAFALVYVTFFGPENLPPLEAFALGCPVIASNVPGAQEQLGDAALLVPPTSEEEIAAALLSLYRDDALRRRLVEEGRARASAYPASRFVEGLFGVLDDLEPVIRTWR